ncbi:MAG: hypothetical protein HKN04_13550 [Rhodothermaceae bacterium]|nr:hypothetical protein [Rhodothermaceae bacterium]
MAIPNAATQIPEASEANARSPVEEAEAKAEAAEARAEEAQARLERAEAMAENADEPVEQIRAEAEIARAEAAKARAEAEEALAKNAKKRAKLEKDLKKMGSKRGVETMFRTSYRTNMDLSSLADAKANIMISINGLIISILLASIAPGIDTNPWLLFPTTLLLLGCVSSLVFAILAARPRVQSHEVTLQDVKNKAANLLFFGNFAHLSRDEFLSGMEEIIIDGGAVYRNMMMDIYGLGLVLQKKYKLLRVAYTMFMIGLVVGVVAFIITFYIAAKSGQQIPDVTTPIPLIPGPSGTTPAQ